MLTWLAVPVSVVFKNVFDEVPINIWPAPIAVNPVPPLPTGTVPVNEILGVAPPEDDRGKRQLLSQQFLHCLNQARVHTAMW